MKKIIAVMALSALLLGRCTPATMPEALKQNDTSSASEVSAVKEYAPLNYESPKGVWLPYLEYDKLMQGSTADEFRTAVNKRLSEFRDNGMNTVYVHIRPTGDAYYSSTFFPKGKYLGGDYDPLEIILDEAHDMELSVHGWINPLRLQTTEEMAEIPDSFITKQWYSSGDDLNIGEADGRLYLRPDSPEVRELLANEIREIIGTYDVDGIHIDDYFYPDTDPSFDAGNFSLSGESDLTKWRTDAVSEMVKAMYSAVKDADERVMFGISPQGNIKADYETQYADVRRWISEEGFCDYIVPQIYYGFKNETLPFSSVLEEWERMAENSNVRLIIGLGAYKLGKEDRWAGESGESEWLDDPAIIDKQTQAVLDSSADGYAVYY